MQQRVHVASLDQSISRPQAGQKSTIWRQSARFPPGPERRAWLRWLKLADEIFASRRVKPSIAYATNQCASAALWLGAQATQLVAQPSSDIGSVGVMCVHFDCSQQLAAEGVRPTIIASTAYKAELSPLSPLSPEALAYEQGRINALHGDFVSALARGRGVDAAAV
jgi:ClpP class serine protease